MIFLWLIQNHLLTSHHSKELTVQVTGLGNNTLGVGGEDQLYIGGQSRSKYYCTIDRKTKNPVARIVYTIGFSESEALESDQSVVLIWTSVSFP